VPLNSQYPALLAVLSGKLFLLPEPLAVGECVVPEVRNDGDQRHADNGAREAEYSLSAHGRLPLADARSQGLPHSGGPDVRREDDLHEHPAEHLGHSLVRSLFIKSPPCWSFYTAERCSYT